MQLTIIAAGALLYIAFAVLCVSYAGVMLALLVGCFLADWFDRFVERHAIHANVRDPMPTRLIAWGTIEYEWLSHRVRFLRIRLPLSLTWRWHYPGNRWRWYERQIVWLEGRGWFIWYEPVEWV